MPAEIPADLSELTAGWLTEALRAGGVIRDASVVGFEVEPIGEGEGFTGALARLSLRYDKDEDGAPRTLIAKFPTADVTTRASVEALQVYEHEIRFYDDLAGSVPMRVPRRYYGDMDPNPLERVQHVLQRFFDALPVWLLRFLLRPLMALARASNRRYVLLLEDLAPHRVGDQIQGADATRAADCVRAVAEHHAAFWQSEALDQTRWLPSIAFGAPSLQALFKRSRADFFETYADRLPPELADAADWIDRHGVAIARHMASPPVTLIHGDYRLDNMFFRESGPPAPIAVDWQLVARARGVWDVAYFATTNLRRDEVSAEPELVRIYHAELVKHGVQGYSLDECVRDYQLGKLLLVQRLVAAHGLIKIDGERGTALQNLMIDRLMNLLPTGPYSQLLGPGS
ncbi:MAG: phosphotransferase [Deltaproteobacteria bacterium]|nr:phosphotransferase [Deltaproteobacteria bacterium]MBW2415146.1 phosphotransferase [Deltaproteobacteria bacterium]